MICCNKCFCDIELKPIIEGLGQKGKCPICNNSDTYIYDSDKNTELVAYFDDLISIYTPAHLLPSDFPKGEVQLLKDELLRNWNIFNNISAMDVYRIITSICNDKYQETPELFDYPVGIAELYDPEYLDEHSIVKTNRWEDFVSAVKTQNRFHTNHINTEIMNEFFSYIRKPYKKGNIFYRGRISESAGFNTDKMGAPPNELATAGRANAQGISCLYLADTIETTIHEVRAGAFDFITVGEFELQEDIIVVDLKFIDKISPFIGLDNTKHAINKEHLNKINAEMGKALRRSDSVLDYIPTQYISDFVKSIEDNGKPVYAGMEYNSTVNLDGFNLAIFNPDLFKCVNVNVFKIENLDYKIKKIV